MPRFLDPSHAPLDPALVLFAQFGFADLEDLASLNAEFVDLFRHYGRHVHHPIAFERVQDLFAIASFDALAIVPAEGYFDWGVRVESQNSIRHCCSPCASSGGGSNPSSGGSGKSSGGSSSSSRSSSGSSPISYVHSSSVDADDHATSSGRVNAGAASLATWTPMGCRFGMASSGAGNRRCSPAMS